MPYIFFVTRILSLRNSAIFLTKSNPVKELKAVRSLLNSATFWLSEPTQVFRPIPKIPFWASAEQSLRPILSASKYLQNIFSWHLYGKYGDGLSENKSDKLDFSSQVNFAVENVCENDYFIVVEYDDMVIDKWVKMALPYMDSRQKCPIFLPLIEIYDINNP
mgnify:CR=1 FL=1